MDRELETGTDHLIARVEHGVGVVVLNRPERRNALTAGMLEALMRVLPELEAAPDVGSVLLTGAGAAFCAGGDVRTFAERGGVAGAGAVLDEADLARRRAVQRATTGRLHAFAKPTLAALPGAAAGAGIGLALACDLRLGSTAAVFVPAFAAVGLSGDFGATWLLTRLAGPARARRLLLLGERLDAAAAREWGLLDRVVEPAELADVALTAAAALAGGPREALAAIKLNVRDAEHLPLDEAMDREVERHLSCGLTQDHREAVRAFVEKRPPVWSAASTSTNR